VRTRQYRRKESQGVVCKPQGVKTVGEKVHPSTRHRGKNRSPRSIGPSEGERTVRNFLGVRLLRPGKSVQNTNRGTHVKKRKKNPPEGKKRNLSTKGGKPKKTKTGPRKKCLGQALLLNNAQGREKVRDEEWIWGRQIRKLGLDQRKG